jgi:hypothetical protein
MRSVVVVLPASMCATMPMFRRWGRSIDIGGGGMRKTLFEWSNGIME